MKVYLSAPISGVEDQNSFAFGFCQSILEYMGYEVVNPLNIEPLYIKGRGEWEAHMAADIRELVTCDVLCLIRPKGDSRGVALEVELAKQLGIKIVEGLPQFAWPEKGVRDAD